MSYTPSKSKAMLTAGKVLINKRYFMKGDPNIDFWRIFYIYHYIEFIKMNDLTKSSTQGYQTGPELNPILDFAVIGAGIAGLTAASKISALGHKLAVFEKARGTGGRLSSKRVVYDGGEAMAFDLGCVSITGKSEKFSQQLESWHSGGVIAPWWMDDQNKTHYVAVSRNSALTRHLSENLECHFSTRVSSLQRIDDIWHLFTFNERGENEGGENDRGEKLLAKAKNVILATPPAQAYDLLPAGSRFKGALESVKVGAQWVMGLELDNDLSGLPAISYPKSDTVYSISQESCKPGRRNREFNVGSTILQVQASQNWTREHLESTHEQVKGALMRELEQHLQQPLRITNAYVHRWLYSCITQGIETKEGYLWDEEGLGLIGDYLNTDFDGVESAWLSGQQLAEQVTS